MTLKKNTLTIKTLFLVFLLILIIGIVAWVALKGKNQTGNQTLSEQQGTQIQPQPSSQQPNLKSSTNTELEKCLKAVDAMEKPNDPTDRLVQQYTQDCYNRYQ